MVVLGIFGAYVINWALKGVAHEWRWMLGIGAIPGLALAIGMYFQPFSPRWLMQQGRTDEAREVLRRARSSDDEVNTELDEIEQETQREGGLSDLWKPGVRAMVRVGLVLAIAQQLIGVNTVIYYAQPSSSSPVSPRAARSPRPSRSASPTCSSRSRRSSCSTSRPPSLLITGTVGCIVSLGTLGAFFASGALQRHAPWLALVSLIVYIASFAVGLGPVFWLMISEIFPLRVRSPAMSVSTVANWSSNFLVSTFFLSLVGAITRQGTFWLYAGFGVLALVFFVLRLPETKDRSLEEIAQELSADSSRQAA